MPRPAWQLFADSSDAGARAARWHGRHAPHKEADFHTEGDGQKDGETDRQKDGETDGRTTGQTDGLTG